MVTKKVQRLREGRAYGYHDKENNLFYTASGEGGLQIKKLDPARTSEETLVGRYETLEDIEAAMRELSGDMRRWGSIQHYYVK